MTTRKTWYLIGLTIFLSVQSFAQSFNKESDSNGKPLLLGKINKEALSEEPYGDWFNKNYSNYISKQHIIDSLQKSLKSYTITVFMGTWCGDSKREVPKLYKVLDEAKFPLERVTTVAVHNQRDQYKQSPGGEHEGLNIHRVPTIIINKNGKEINRIVESPKNSIEEDILNILSDNYQSKYESVTYIDELIKEKGSTYLSKKSKKLIPMLKTNTESIAELNTYGNVLFFDGQQKEALAVLELNTLLFPKEAKVYVSLGNKYMHMNNSKKAIEFYEKSLKFSKNPQIEDMIEKLRTSEN